VVVAHALRRRLPEFLQIPCSFAKFVLDKQDRDTFEMFRMAAQACAASELSTHETTRIAAQQTRNQE
jgi:hypothetical protein